MLALGGGIQINGNATSRIFFVNSGANVTLNSLTLINGNGQGGGAIYIDMSASLTVNNCAFNRNQGYDNASAEAHF